MDTTPRGDIGRHHAFIAYHRASSRRAAEALQSRLESVARRSAADPPLRVFRDVTGLTYGALDETLRRNLEASTWLVVVLHGRTIESEWVNSEITHWLAAGGDPSRLVPVKVDPDLPLMWDKNAGGFVNPKRLPEALRDAFPAEPLWLDVPFRWPRRFDDPTSQIARLCATLLEREPEQVLQRELRAERRRKTLLGGGLAVTAVLAVLALVASVIAVRNRDTAREREADAVAQAGAAESLLVSSERPDQAVELLVEASNRSPDRSVRTAIYAVLEENRRLTGILPEPASFGGQAPDDVAFSGSQRRLIGWRVLGTDPSPDDDAAPARQVAFALWDVETLELLSEGIASGAEPAEDGMLQLVAPVGEEGVIYCGAEGLETVRFGRGAPVHETLVVGTDRCLAYPLRGGAFGLARQGAGEAEAVLLGDAGEATRIPDVLTATGEPYGDVVFVDTAVDGLRALTADGQRHVTLAQPGWAGIEDLLWLDDVGTIILRSEDGRVMRAGAFEPDPVLRALPIPGDAAAVVEMDRQPATYAWLTATHQLQWSLGPQSLDLSGLVADATPESTVTPGLWVGGGTFGSGAAAVVGFADRAVRVELGLPPSVSPSMTQAETIPIETHYSERTELMAWLERGNGGVILPTSASTDVIVNADGDIDEADGIAYFDPTGTVAVSFGDAPVRLYPGGFSDPEEISSADDPSAVTLSPMGDAMAVVRPASPVTLYSTVAPERLASPVSDAQESWRTAAAFGRDRFRAIDGGQRILATPDEGPSRTIDDFAGRLTGVHAVRPDGDAVVIAVADRSSVSASTSAVVVDRSGGAEELPSSCSEAGALAYLPGAGFRTEIDAAELQQLVSVPDAEDAGGASPIACEDRSRPPETAAPGDVLDYQLDDSRGRIVARRSDGQIDVTTWRRGDAGSLATSVIPGTDAETKVSADMGSDTVATWRPGAGAVSVLRASGDGWEQVVSVRSAMEDIAAVLPDEDQQVLTVVGATSVEAFEMRSGRLLFRRAVDLTANGAGEEATARWVRGESVGGDYVVHIGLARGGGLVREGHRVTIPMDIEVLRDRLCGIHPRATGCG